MSFSTSFFFFYLSHPSGCFGVSWFWFPFLWWLVMLNIFLWIHSIKPFVYLLWRTVYSGTLPTLKSDCLFTIELCLLYIPDKSPESNKWFTNIFSFCVHIVHILHGVLWSTKMLNFDEFQFIYFFFYHTFSIMSKKLLPNPRS